ncbi:Uncharacterised protein [Vibrio cholerae]|uniref:Uncharacterized protein n=1 Tax=Vibrio cholerae TaxID=666 RepID=A0A655P188_VIBCL|nr:Uncharacterised protein [Vibrio cholerae]CSC16396.1 Uncharacterised protein [Vibrio cholerae]
MARNDVIHMLVVQRAHQIFQLFRQLKRFDFCRVRQAIHHMSNTAKLECFGNGFPTKLQKLARITRVDAISNHFLVTNDRARLQHTAENGLLTHQIGFHFRYKRRS